MVFDKDLNWAEWVAIIIIILGIIHTICWLITKAIIWAFYGLFNINWYGKFWYVYILTLIIGLFMPYSNYKKK